jgi:large subunit ribosomal protein L10
MPNAKVLSEKQAVVAGLIETLKSSASGVLVNYEGITVAEDTNLRNELRKAGVEYAVVKNTMVRRALDDTGLSELDDVLHGTTSLAVSKEDPIAPMRVIHKFAKGLEGDRFVIKAGFMDGKVLPLADIAALAELPSKEVLLGQVLGMMLSPITSLAIVIKAIAEKGGVPAEKTEEAPAAEAAPAEETPAAEAAAPAEEAPAAEAVPAAEEAAPETPAE